MAAGMHVGQSPLAHTPLEHIRRQLEVNVVGQVAVTQARAIEQLIRVLVYWLTLRLRSALPCIIRNPWLGKRIRRQPEVSAWSVEYRTLHLHIAAPARSIAGCSSPDTFCYVLMSLP